MYLTLPLFLGLIVFLQTSVHGEIRFGNSACENVTSSLKCFINHQTAQENESVTWLFTSNSTAKYFAFEHFDMDEDDVMLLFHGNTTKDMTLLTANFTTKSDPFLAITFSSDATLVFKSGSKQYNRSFLINYNTKVCEIFVKQMSGIVKSPIFSPSAAGRLNCTYHLSTTSTSGHVALAFDKTNLTKGSIRVWDGKSRAGSLVVNYTAKDEGKIGDVVSTKQDIVLEASLPTSKLETFSANFLTESSVCPGGVVHLNKTRNLISPGFPNDYDNNIDCRWTVVAPEGFTIKLDFLTVDLADTVDTIIINDGGAKASDPLLDVNIGYKQTGLLMTSTNKILIRFRTDESQTSKGFNLTLTPQEYGGFAKNEGRIVLKQHGNMSTDHVRDTPNVTIPSPPIYYLLQAPVGLQVRLEINDSFLMPTSTIDLRDGANVNATLIGHFRSDTPAYPVVSSSNQMLVVANGFYIDGIMSRQYFIADFTSIQPGSQVSLSGDSGSASLRESNLNKTATYIIVNPRNNSLVSLKLHDLYLPHNATASIYRGPSENSIRLLELTGSVDEEASRTLPVIYTKEARIVYKLNSTDGVSPNRLLLSFSYQIIPGCDGHDLSKASGGSLVSPLYPNQYASNSHCSWSFTPVQNTLLRLNFKNFALIDGHTLVVEADHYHVQPNKTLPVTVRTEILRNITGSPQDIPDMIISMNNNSINTTKVKVTFDSTFKGQASDLEVADGFRIDYEHLVCGGNLTLPAKSVETPKFPAPIDVDTLRCVWVIDIPSHPESDNTSVNIVKYQYTIKHFSKETNTSATKVEVRDGGSEKGALVVLSEKEGDSGDILSRTNKLWIMYTYNRTKGDKDKGFAFKLSYSTNTCGAKDLCDNGVCMHSDWKCNGKDECGDDSDERNCFHATNTVSRLVLGMSIVVTFIIATILACIVPALYKRMKYPNYSELRDLMTPVPT